MADPTFAPPASKLVGSGIPNTPRPAAGFGLTLDARGKVPGDLLVFQVLASDPSDPQDGDVWIRSDLNQLRWREGGVTYQVTGTAV